MADNFLRYLMLLREIPRAPRRVDTATLARRLEDRGIAVTRRTLQRDLERLSATFPLACHDGTKPYGWSWVENRDKPEPWPERIRALAQVAREIVAPGPGARRRRRRDLYVVLHFDDKAAGEITRVFPDAEITKSRTGSYRLETLVPDAPELRAWLRSLGDDVEVLAPEKLRNEFRALAVRLARLYDGK